MEIKLITERFILRGILPTDDVGFFELDSNPAVHRYLGNNPVTDIEQVREVIKSVRQQYIDNGIGRWAVIDKTTNEFIGWSGLKLIKEPINNHNNFYDIGYRLIEKHWGQGIATETSLATAKYAFETLNLKEIYGITRIGNNASINVLQKTGLKLIETFYRDGAECNWFKMTKNDWENRIQKTKVH